jgi:excisionase family DNA binding protein
MPVAITVTGQEIIAKGSVSVPEARKIIGCGKTVMYAMLRDGTLPYTKVRSGKTIPMAAIEKYLQQNLVQG